MEKEELLKNLTGYPSIDRPWLKYYRPNVEKLATDIPANKTIWDLWQEKLLEYYDIPALEYFGREFSKQEFIDLCYIWGRTFRAMGVQENEMVPVYGPFVPDVCAMLFGLNMIGAVPYFLKLAISPEALAEETKDSKVAVVFDQMWKNVAHEFSKDKYKNIIIASAPTDMPVPLKQIVQFKNKIQARKDKCEIPDDSRFIWADKAREMANYYTGKVEVPFAPNRPAIITSSSGTTVGGIVKGTVATNESVIGQILSGAMSDVPYFPGDRVLNHFPPTASTSLNSLFFLGLYHGEIVVLDPRVSEKDYYRQLTKLKPNIALTTGSLWEVFFNRVEQEMNKGKKFDFSFAKGWTIGGEGTDSKKFQHWNELMLRANANNMLFSGYGLSEIFSAVSVDNRNAKKEYPKPMVGVGIPQAGMIMGVFDENGKELPYNTRGELRIKSKAMMKEYYNKPELTEKTIVDGWVKTGDLAEFDENGQLYVWGRINDSIMVNNQRIYMFDVANKIKEKNYIVDALVLSKPTIENKYNLAAHIVWSDEIKNQDKTFYINELSNMLKDYLPDEVKLTTFAPHDKMIPYSPTTLKKDKNGLSKQAGGYVMISNNELENIEYVQLGDGNYYIQTMPKELVRRRIK